jgi:hypothetical protein
MAAVRQSALVLALAACGSGSGGRAGGETPVEARLRLAVGAAVGLQVDRVTCAGPATCTAVVDGVALPISVRDAGAELAWEIAGLVVRGEALRVEVDRALNDLGLAARVDCGPRALVVPAGGRVTCTIHAVIRAGQVVYGEARALARIAPDGTAAIELVLGGTAIAARTTPVSVAALDERSRALDRDDAEGDDGEAVDAVPADAAPGPDAAP